PQGRSLFDEDYFNKYVGSGNDKLLDYDAQEIRKIFQQRYRHFWNLPGLKTFMAEFPCYPILDDHDIVDNWGADPAHQEPQWKSLGLGARWAYLDYQGTRMIAPPQELPSEFHYVIEYGSIAVFVMDIRSQRRAGDNGQLYSDAQQAEFENFLKKNQDKKMLFVVLSVPIVHLPRLLARLMSTLPPSGEDFSDRWSSGKHVEDRDRFLEILHDHQISHPEQPVVLLSGDIHIGCVHRIRWNKKEPDLFQVVSSPISHSISPMIGWGSNLLIRMNRKISTLDGKLKGKVRLLKGVKGYRKNPYIKMNVAIVEISTPSSGAIPKAEFFLYGHEGVEPVCVYRSGRISTQ
ncbi:MAG: alkaline phosphatase D family protein, partial [Calditrichia bacterium]